MDKEVENLIRNLGKFQVENRKENVSEQDGEILSTRMPWNDSELEIYKELREDLDKLQQEVKTLRAELRKHKHLEDGAPALPL